VGGQARVNRALDDAQDRIIFYHSQTVKRRKQDPNLRSPIHYKFTLQILISFYRIPGNLTLSELNGNLDGVGG